MEDRRPLIYLAAAIVIIAIIYILERPDESRIDDTSYTYLVEDFDVDKIVSFEVTQLLSGAKIKRDGEGWLVTEMPTEASRELMAGEGRTPPEERWRPADSERVVAALARFAGLSEGMLASDNPDKRSIYQVDAAGVEVTAYSSSGAKLFDVVIGKNGPDFMGTYVRRADEESVWLTARPLVGVFSPRASDWEIKEAGPEE